LSAGAVFGEVLKKEVIDFCRNGVIPFTFQEKMRMTSGSGGRRGLAGGECDVAVVVTCSVFLRFAGGGLISRSILIVM